MEIYIDNVRMDTDERTSVSLNLAVSTVAEPEKNRTGYTNIIILPVTENNRKVMDSADQINAAGIFNHSDHRATVVEDGCTVMEGVPVLVSCTATDTRQGMWPCYRIGIVGSGKMWADMAAATMIRALPVPFEQTLTPALILNSWTWDAPVRFLPVQRDGFQVLNHSSNLIAPVKILSMEDYHPFLHLKSVLDMIFEQAGYRLRSDFMESEFFSKLHISGNYPLKSSMAAKARMDFKAGRFTSVSATANSLGIVYANSYITINTLGNIVETADPEQQHNGVKLSGVFDNGGCFNHLSGRIAFVPLYETTLAIEYTVRYTTDHYIADRDRLDGFDTFYYSDYSDPHTFTLANTYTDRRGDFYNLRSYTLVVFGHGAGNTYRFVYDETVGGGTTAVVNSQFNTRTAKVSVASSGTVAGPRLYIQNGSGSFVEYTGDWALYDGYVEEYGTTDVELKLRTPAQKATPSNPLYLDKVHFSGAHPGMKITLSDKTTLRPVFTEYPALGSKITFEEVAAHDFNCLDLVKSVRHLFNLRFYTDEVSRNVYAEPYPDFYASDNVTDWSDRIDLSKPVVITEPSAKLASRIEYCYRTGDGAVTRRNMSAGDTLGKWIVGVDNSLTKESVREIANDIFTASLNNSGDYPGAVDASLVQAGDRETTLSDDLENLNFLPKIVVYEGMRSLPGSQRWGWPSNGPAYPYIAFRHTTGDNNGTGDCEPFSLCFEDRDGITGLHTYRDREIDQLTGGKRIELYLTLSPADIEAILRPNSLLRDFRGLFRLTIGGERALYRLEEIAEYTPGEGGSTRCVLLREYPA